MNERSSQFHLSLRKNNLNSYFDSKRKISPIKNNENTIKFQLKESNLNIPCQFEVELNKYYSNVIIL